MILSVRIRFPMTRQRRGRLSLFDIHAFGAIPKLSSLGIRRQVLTHFSGSASETEPDKYHILCGVGFEKGGLIFEKNIAIYIKKAARELMFSCGLEFLILKKMSSLPEIRRLLRN